MMNQLRGFQESGRQPRNQTYQEQDGENERARLSSRNVLVLLVVILISNARLDAIFTLER